jgi:outer membrane receptor protein involved in Fe transport
MGLDIPGTPSKDFSNLVPVAIDNSNSSVEEIRYEPFTVHNWQINDRMTLESSIIYETSTIEQSGDVSRKRDFDFVKPKLDYRYDITPTLQLRAGVEKDVSQLSFSDFSASTDNNDEDKNTQAGNPEIVQEKSWRYELNLEFRLPNDAGVVNSQFWYRDVEDHIDRVDVTTSLDNLQSARGNIGDGNRYGLNLDVSAKLDRIRLPNALLTTGIRLRDSEFTDPFLGIKRRQRNNGRWSLNMGFRHDITSQQLTYGINYSNNSNGSTGRKEFDINDIEERIQKPYLSAYIEKKAFGNLTFRFESRNMTENEFCRTRTRFDGAIGDGIVKEVEDYCNGNGMELALRVRTTF